MTDADFQPHWYDIDLHQGDLYIQLSSDDIQFIARQMERWYTVFTNEKLYPIAIPLGLPKPTSPGPPPQPSFGLEAIPTIVQSQLAQATVSPSLSEGTTAREADLLQQIQSLQSQLGQQTTHPSKPAEGYIDDFVNPAHDDMQATQNAFPSFEQPVNNPAIFVENPSNLDPPTVAQTQLAMDSAPSAATATTPVDNWPAEDPTLLAATPEMPDGEENFDLLLDSLMSDFEAQDFSAPSVPIPQTVERPASQSDSKSPENKSQVDLPFVSSPAVAAVAPEAPVLNLIQEAPALPEEEDAEVDAALLALSMEMPSTADHTPAKPFETAFPDPDDPAFQSKPEPVVEALPETLEDQHAPLSEATELETLDLLDIDPAPLDLAVESLIELCEMAPKAANGMDFLMLSAFFLSAVQHVDKYSLKDLNSQLVRSGLTPVNHGLLENVVTKEYLRMVPDLTGTAHAAEYEMTEMGQRFVRQLMGP